MFADDRYLDIGQAIVASLSNRLGASVLSLTVQSWHVHVVIAATRHDVGDVVKCFKDAARYLLRAGQPIWAGGYDKRFCFDARSLANRVDYVARHNERLGLPRSPSTA